MPRKQRRDWPDVLTKAEAAEYLRCSPDTIQRLTAQRRLMPYRIGQRPRYPLVMLQRYVAEESGDHPATA